MITLQSTQSTVQKYLCRHTDRTVNNVIVDVWIVGENFHQSYSILMGCEELQVCLKVTDNSSS